MTAHPNERSRNGIVSNALNIPVINDLRGVAAFSVCIYHFTCLPINFITTKWIFDIFYFGQLGVQMFFVISGIVIPLSMIKSEYSLSNWSKFIWKRFVRLEPPYIIAIVIALLYFQVRRFIPSSAAADMMLTPKEILLHIGYAVPLVDGARWAIPSLWTLSVEFQYYLTLSLLFPIALRHNRYRIIFYILMLTLPFIFPSGAFFPGHASLFMLGIVYALCFAKKISLTEYAIVSVAAFTITFLTLPFSHGIVGLLTIATVHFLKDFHNRYLGYLGAISYSLYLIHQSTGVALLNFLSHRVDTAWGKAGVICIAFIVSIACAAAMYKLVELPSLRWSKAVRYVIRNPGHTT